MGPFQTGRRATPPYYIVRFLIRGTPKLRSFHALNHIRLIQRLLLMGPTSHHKMNHHPFILFLHNITHYIYHSSFCSLSLFITHPS
ncbi:hypothetical protein RIF29_37009 [Crotalaria pallida]|uniref:Uncharacterized protein n=1 Tax=Crotalaria pallida TaxID=3830 RepID=A0AAN9EBW5_CROPI